MNQPKKRPSVRPPLFMRWGRDAGGDAEASQLREQLDAANARLAAVEATHERCAAQLRELQDRNTSLVQLTVASQLLCGAVDRDDILNAIEEIVVNMIGSEEIVVLELLPNEDRMKVARSRGIDGTSERFAAAVEPIREAIATGRVVLPKGKEITAIVPLLMDSTTFGVLAVFRLLEQKPALDALDHELLDLMSRQAAVAIFSAAFRSMKATVRPPTKSSS